VGSGVNAVECTTMPSMNESNRNVRISIFCRCCGSLRANDWMTCGYTRSTATSAAYIASKRSNSHA